MVSIATTASIQGAYSSNHFTKKKEHRWAEDEATLWCVGSTEQTEIWEEIVYKEEL